MKYDVIIAGAGPVGLFLATELAQAACSVLILERAESPHSPLKQLPFGMRGLSAPTIAAFDRRGLLQELEVHRRVKNPHQNAGQGARRQLGHFAGIPFHEGDVAIAQCNLISEMAEIESVLARRAAALGVEIRRGLALTSFDQGGEGVGVRAGDQTFEAQWLVGCDGARSAVRKLGGFEFAGTAAEFTGYTLQVEIADPDQLKSGRNMTAAGMYLQSQPGYLVLQDFDGGAFHQSRAPVTLEHAQQVLRRISETDVTLTALHLASTWSDQARQATRYRDGRILLAGDAAHVHSPLGGQGLNLGIGDAADLGWKLAATIKGTAPATLLDSYHAERHPAGARVLDWSRAQVAVMRPDPHARALRAILGDLMNTRDGATYFARRVWGVDALCGPAN
jgi:2-polyprenyl-6-methoxyphenol hydroxylase-like FAD-dependent oxidoreductase